MYDFLKLYNPRVIFMFEKLEKKLNRIGSVCVFTKTCITLIKSMLYLRKKKKL